MFNTSYYTKRCSCKDVRSLNFDIIRHNQDKNRKTFAPRYSQSPQSVAFTPTFGFLGLEISTATAESRGGAWCFFYMKRHLFSVEKNNQKSIERRKTRQKTIPPLGSEFHSKQSKLKFVHCIAFVERPKRIETSSLRNLQIMPRNLNEILRNLTRMF